MYNKYIYCFVFLFVFCFYILFSVEHEPKMEFLEKFILKKGNGNPQ